VRRVTEGEADHPGMWSHLGHGEHRGRGPKNYTRSDDRIREDVNDRLTDDTWLDASDIDVQVSGSEVTLTGTVSSRDDKRRAEDLAEQVSGVRHVQNNLRVQSNAAASADRSTTAAGGATTASSGGMSYGAGAASTTGAAATASSNGSAATGASTGATGDKGSSRSSGAS